LTTLYFDCASGAAGDMILGALIDAGVPLEEVRAALGSLAIAPDTIWTQQVHRAGIAATKLCVRGEDPGVEGGVPHEGDASHDLAHAHADVDARGGHRRSPSVAPRTHRHAAGHDEHRTLAEIHRLIERSALSATGKARAQHLFTRLAEAEAAIHGTTLDRVHLHEVGALDSIIDVVGSVFALESLRVDRVVASPLNVGGGTVRSAHGLYSVPAPATLRLLQGAPTYSAGPQVELVTPTGALLITDYATDFGRMPAMRPQRIGYGAGSRDFTDVPNVLRVVIGETEGGQPRHAHVVVVIEAEIDDMNPQLFGVLMERLLGDGALDVYYTPIQMKKNRPGILLTVVAPPHLRETLTTTVFRESTTIGVRFRDMQRECLDRETVPVDTPFGAVRVKVARRDGILMNAAPEFDDCVRVATEHGRPVKEVQALALKLFMDR
jgi:uncharacterized protein (TIGR00299 family) protein